MATSQSAAVLRVKSMTRVRTGRARACAPVLHVHRCPPGLALHSSVQLGSGARRCVAVRAAADESGVEEEHAWTEDNTLRWEGHTTDRIEASEDAPAVVILPGFGNCNEDYEAPFGVPERSLQHALRSRGYSVHVVPIERKDWFNIARAIFSIAYWRGTCTTDPGYTWYLDRVNETVAKALEESGKDCVTLVGHSAGGWLARAFLADPKYQDGASDESDSESDVLIPNPNVAGIITLGTPQCPPPADKVKDMTGGAVGWVNDRCPGAFFQNEGIPYVTVAGRSVRGDESAEPSTLTRYAAGSYMQVCGYGHEVEGDCVVPLQSAHLDGAATITLNGVFHSMSKIGTYSEPGAYVWYGSDEVADVWLAEYEAALAAVHADSVVAKTE